MPLVPSDQNLLIIDLHNTASFNEIDVHLDAHVRLLEQNDAAGRLIASRLKTRRTGGLIISTVKTRAVPDEVLDTDPFKKMDWRVIL